ncbi:MAG: hypothetical protein U0263_32570 [Polyangiaceae bacterium]
MTRVAVSLGSFWHAAGAVLCLLAGTACSSGDSSSSGGGGGGNTAPLDCSARCAAVAAECALDPNECGGVCGSVSEKELGCMESSHCNSAAYEGCLGQGSGGAGGAGGGGVGGSGGGPAGCNAFKCAGSSECAFQACMSTSTGVNYCYALAASPAGCAAGTTAVTALVAGASQTVCKPTGCPEPEKYLP